ncbi:MAG: RNA-binding protein [Alphaproteobacteria bacterium]
MQQAAIESEFQEKAPQRRCFATGAVRYKTELVRFVIAPDGAVVPDIEEKLPGRGLWLTASRDIITASSGKGLFAKAARAPARAPANLADQVEALLARRCLDLLGFARRAGQVTTGFEKVRAWLGAGKAFLLLEASDGAEDGRRKLAISARDIPVIDLFRGDELSQALGRENAVHVAVRGGKLAALLQQEAARLAGFRGSIGNDETKRYKIARNSEG